MVEDKKVAILMSTFNGCKFLPEQIDSILNQSYNNWELYIRDDNSLDETKAIILRYEKKNKKIHFSNVKENENIGVTSSFFSLLNSVNADIYMFADQDDYWLSDKIKNTVNLLNTSRNTPALVHTDLKVVNANLEVISDSMKKKVGNVQAQSRIQLLSENVVTGCTIGFNNLLKEKLCLQKLNFKQIKMHDWWLAICASYFGKVLYLNTPTVLYRQHESNVLGSNNRISVSQLKDSVDYVFNQAQYFLQFYQSRLAGQKSYQELIAFVNIPRFTFVKKLRYFVKFPEFKQSNLKNIIFELIVLFRME